MGTAADLLLEKENIEKRLELLKCEILSKQRESSNVCIEGEHGEEKEVQLGLTDGEDVNESSETKDDRDKSPVIYLEDKQVEEEKNIHLMDAQTVDEDVAKMDGVDNPILGLLERYCSLFGYKLGSAAQKEHAEEKDQQHSEATPDNDDDDGIQEKRATQEKQWITLREGLERIKKNMLCDCKEKKKPCHCDTVSQRRLQIQEFSRLLDVDNPQVGAENTTTDKLNKAFRKLSPRIHPDTSPHILEKDPELFGDIKNLLTELSGCLAYSNRRTQPLGKVEKLSYKFRETKKNGKTTYSIDLFCPSLSKEEVDSYVEIAVIIPRGVNAYGVQIPMRFETFRTLQQDSSRAYCTIDSSKYGHIFKKVEPGCQHGAIKVVKFKSTSKGKKQEGAPVLIYPRKILEDNVIFPSAAPPRVTRATDSHEARSETRATSRRECTPSGGTPKAGATFPRARNSSEETPRVRPVSVGAALRPEDRGSLRPAGAPAAPPPLRRAPTARPPPSRPDVGPEVGTPKARPPLVTPKARPPLRRASAGQEASVDVQDAPVKGKRIPWVQTTSWKGLKGQGAPEMRDGENSWPDWKRRRIGASQEAASPGGAGSPGGAWRGTGAGAAWNDGNSYKGSAIKQASWDDGSSNKSGAFKQASWDDGSSYKSSAFKQASWDDGSGYRSSAFKQASLDDGSGYRSSAFKQASWDDGRSGSRSDSFWRSRSDSFWR